MGKPDRNRFPGMHVTRTVVKLSRGDKTVEFEWRDVPPKNFIAQMKALKKQGYAVVQKSRLWQR